MYRAGLGVIAVFFGTSTPATAFWGAGAVAEHHTMLALGAALVIAASYTKGRGRRR